MPFSSVSIVDFKQINVSWEVSFKSYSFQMTVNLKSMGTPYAEEYKL